MQSPTTRARVEETDAAKLMRLIESLEDNDDVQGRARDFDMDAEV